MGPRSCTVRATRRTTILPFTFAIAIALHAPSEASAQGKRGDKPPASKPSEADEALERAREQFREGLALMTAEDYAGALAKFKATARVKMSPQVAFNIAECEEKLGKFVSALGNYRLALAKASEGGADSVAAAAPARIALLEPKIARLTVTRREERANPAATLELDGLELVSSQVGSALPTDPGEHVVRVLLDGKTVSTERFKLSPGETRQVAVPIPAPQQASPIPASPERAPASPPPPPEPPSLALPIGLLVGGGVALAAGGLFLGLRQGAIGDLDATCSADGVCPESARSTYDSGRLYTGLAEGLLPVGLAAGVTGLVLLLTAEGDAESPADEASAAVSGSVQFGAPRADGPGATITLQF
jgi:hypothetical protein